MRGQIRMQLRSDRKLTRWLSSCALNANALLKKSATESRQSHLIGHLTLAVGNGIVFEVKQSRLGQTKSTFCPATYLL
jgi:hypothetical protein